MRRRWYGRIEGLSQSVLASRMEAAKGTANELARKVVTEEKAARRCH